MQKGYRKLSNILKEDMQRDTESSNMQKCFLLYEMCKRDADPESFTIFNIIKELCKGVKFD